MTTVLRYVIGFKRDSKTVYYCGLQHDLSPSISEKIEEAIMMTNRSDLKENLDYLKNEEGLFWKLVHLTSSVEFFEF